MKSKPPDSRSVRSRRVSLLVEACEPRQLLATFMVTSAADNGDNTNPIAGSLRAEILLSNASPAPTGQMNQISFNIDGPSTIEPTAELPVISVPTVIDGLTQPNTPVVLDGVNVTGPTAQYGLQVTGSNSTIEGLTVDRFSGAGIDCVSGANDQILNNFLGTDPTGESATNSSGQPLGNFDGLIMGGTSGDLIEGNVISGNAVDLGGSASFDLIMGNKIGTDATGTKVLPNLSNTGVINPNGVGIDMHGSGNTIGGTTAGAANVISGNTAEGISIYGTGAVDNLIEGNMIGTDVTGTQPLGNGVGISIIAGASGTTVGGTATGAGNIISGNTGDGVIVGLQSDLIEGNTIDSNGGNGIQVAGTGSSADPTKGLVIQKNLIGTNAAGSAGLGNGNDGILIDDGSIDTLVINNVVSSSAAGSGIEVLDSDNTDIEGNLIGTDLTGTLNLGNHVDGILLTNASNVRIYGSVIVGSVTGDGIDAEGTTTDLDGSVTATFGTGLALIQDHIGLNLAGTAAISNAGVGVQISGLMSASQTTAPTPAPVVVQADVISGNRGVGVNVGGPPGVVIESSLIGTNAAGTAALPNGGGGISINSAGAEVLNNMISGNSGEGLTVLDSTKILVSGNEIGVGNPTTSTTALGNAGGGVWVQSSTGDISQNTISGNTGTGPAPSGDGLDIEGSIDANSTNPEALLVFENKIGTDQTGEVAVPNQGVGIRVGAVSGVTLSFNIVSGNDGAGIEADGTYGVQIDGNKLGDDSTGNVALPNGGDGIDLEQTELASVVGNYVVNNLVNGIAVEGAPSGMFTNAYIAYNDVGTHPVAPSGFIAGFGNRNYGIAISAASAVEVIGNVIASSGVSGVVAYASQTITIEYNDIGTDTDNDKNLGNQGDGIQFTYTSGLIQGNAIGSNGSDGIALSNSPGNTITGNFIGTDANGMNSVLGNQGNGLSIVSSGGQVSSDEDVKFNTIENNGANGVEIEGVASGLVLDHNQIGYYTERGVDPMIGNGNDGILLDDVTAPSGSTSPAVVMMHNLSADNGLDGLQVIGGAGFTSTSDIFDENASNGVEFGSGATGSTLLDDLIDANLAIGALFKESPNNALTDDSIEDNLGLGFALVQSPGVVVTGGDDTANNQGSEL